VKSKLGGIDEKLTPWAMFLWLTCSGAIGVFFFGLFRRHFIYDPKMFFADCVAAPETILVLDSPGGEARDKLASHGLGCLASAVVDFLREGISMIKQNLELLPDIFPTETFARYKAGIEFNLLTVGSGLLIGLNVSLSMLTATVVVVTVGPKLIESGIGREMV